MKKIIFGFSLMLTLVACMPQPKPLAAEDKDFIGKWVGPADSYIIITEKGSAEFEINKKNGNATFTQSAKPAAVTIEGQEMLFEAVFGLKFKYKIVKRPFKQNETWYMVLNDITFQKE